MHYIYSGSRKANPAMAPSGLSMELGPQAAKNFERVDNIGQFIVHANIHVWLPKCCHLTCFLQSKWSKMHWSRTPKESFYRCPRPLVGLRGGVGKGKGEGRREESKRRWGKGWGGACPPASATASGPIRQCVCREAAGCKSITQSVKRWTRFKLCLFFDKVYDG